MKIIKIFFLLGSAFITDSEANTGLDDFSVETYNCLRGAYHAHQDLSKGAELPTCLERASSIIKGYDADMDFLGFRLLHRHNVVSDGYGMVERFETRVEKPVLVTSHSSLSKEGFERIYPASWMKGNNGDRSVFEFSTDITCTRWV